MKSLLTRYHSDIIYNYVPAVTRTEESDRRT